MLERIEDPFDAITVADLDSFETTWNLKLPDSYRTFLLRNNGGTPVPSGFPIVGLKNNPFGSLQLLHGLNTGRDIFDLDWFLRESSINNPPGYLPIGRTGTGDFVGLDLKIEIGQVLFWDAHSVWGVTSATRDDLYLVSEDFPSFLESLRDPRDLMKELGLG